MPYAFHPMDEASARETLAWRYEPPYDFYNPNPDDVDETVQFFLDPHNAYHAITGDDGELVGYCCFGLDARVPGGDYSTTALDVGLRMRPDLTGQGRGLDFVTAILDFARQTFAPQALRVTVATFNKRAMRVYEKAGFERTQVFGREKDGLEFAIMQTERGKKQLDIESQTLIDKLPGLIEELEQKIRQSEDMPNQTIAGISPDGRYDQGVVDGLKFAEARVHEVQMQAQSPQEAYERLSALVDELEDKCRPQAGKKPDIPDLGALLLGGLNKLLDQIQQVAVLEGYSQAADIIRSFLDQPQ